MVIAIFHPLAKRLTLNLRMRLPKQSAAIYDFYNRLWVNIQGEVPSYMLKFKKFIHPLDLFIFSIGLAVLICGGLFGVNSLLPRSIVILSAALLSSVCLIGTILIYSLIIQKR